MSWFYDLQDLLFEFLEKGGPVVLLIGVLIMVMWILIFERLWFFRFSKPQLIQDAREQCDLVRSENGGPGRKSWEGHMIRSMLISQASSSINSNIDLIKVCTAVAPLFGLFGTITGMMEVFHILAVTGGGDAKAMAGGVARSTIPAMAGLFASIPALLALRSIDQAAKKNIEILTERLTYDKKFDVI